MKFVFAMLGVLLGIITVSANAANVQLNYAPGNIFPVQSISDTTTAGGQTRLTGSNQNQIDIWGNRFTSTAFQIQMIDGSQNMMDFFYGYTSNPARVNFWKGSILGPMQRNMTLPTDGIYVSPTFTASGSVSVYFETIQ